MDRQDIATCFLLTNRYGVRAWQSTTTKRRRNQCRRRTKSGCLIYLQAYSMSHLESLTDAESLARKEEGSCPFHKLQEPVCYSNFHALSSWITEKASVIIHHSFDSWNGRQNLHAITLELRLKNKRWTVQKKKSKSQCPVEILYICIRPPFNVTWSYRRLYTVRQFDWRGTHDTNVRKSFQAVR